MTSASPASRPVTRGSIAQAPIRTSQPDHRTSSFPRKTAALLVSSDSISEHKAVRWTIEGISEYGPVFEECFEFENSPSSIRTVKGRFRAHYIFWSQNIGASDLILQIIDKGYAIPFITVTQKAFFGNNSSALIKSSFIQARSLRFPVRWMVTVGIEPCSTL